jgi:hypothetical protein
MGRDVDHAGEVAHRRNRAVSTRAYQPCLEDRFRCFTRARSPRTISAAQQAIPERPREIGMRKALTAFAALATLLMASAAVDTALAQKQGGILRVYHRDSPASMSIHEEGTVAS